MCNNKSKQTRQYLLRTANNHVLGIYPQINQNVKKTEWWFSPPNTLYTVAHKAESLTIKAATRVPFLGICSYKCSSLFVSTFFHRTMRKFNLSYRGTSVCTVKQDWLLDQMHQICGDIFSLWQHWSFTPWVKYFFKEVACSDTYIKTVLFPSICHDLLWTLWNWRKNEKQLKWRAMETVTYMWSLNVFGPHACLNWDSYLVTASNCYFVTSSDL